VTGVSEGGPLAILLAASQPSVVRGLILYGSGAHMNFNLGWPATVGKTVEEVAEVVEARWADGFPGLDVWAPSIEPFPQARAAYQRFARSAASPAAARALLEITFDIDARPLPSARARQSLPSAFTSRSSTLQ
jgi:pimeloyl-ACP methyl ester carboxylesterase